LLHPAKSFINRHNLIFEQNDPKLGNYSISFLKKETSIYTNFATEALHLVKKIQEIKELHTKLASISLMTILILSVTTMSVAPRSLEATSLADLCKTFGISCPDLDSEPDSEPEPQAEPSPSPTPSSSGKFFLALFLQYVNKDTQLNIYKPNMGSEDMTRLRVQDNDVLKSEYVQAALSLPGPAGVAFKSSSEIVENAKRVKDLGFNTIEFNLESGLSPDSDKNDVVGAMKKAAEAAHTQGLKFRATPSKAYTTQYGPQIAPYVDYYHIQAQSLQDNGVKAYSDYVHTTISKLKQANSNLKISVQVSTQQGNAPGLSKLDTLKQCTDAVMDVAHGVSVWFGGDDVNILKSFVQWYNDKWS
jgi:hypothetical protein